MVLGVSMIAAILVFRSAVILPLLFASTASPAAPARSDTLVASDTCESSLNRFGTVRYDFYDTANKTSLGGGTNFHFEFTYTFTYRYVIQNEGNSASVAIHPKVTPSAHVWHDISLPLGLGDSTSWYRRLRRHELDHVAISSDERPSLLFRYLVTHLPTLHRSMEPGAELASLIRAAIADELNARRAAVVDLIQANYNEFDQRTTHGVLPLNDRGAYFDSLYSRPNLEAHRFKWLEEAQPLLDMPRYRNAIRIRCD